MKIEGTPEAMIVGLWEFAIQECGHRPESSEPPLAAVRREVERLRKQVQNSLANNLCSDHRDKQKGKPCLACEIDRLEMQVEHLEDLIVKNDG